MPEFVARFLPCRLSRKGSATSPAEVSSQRLARRNRAAGAFFTRPAAIAGTAIYITLVGATEALLLRLLYHPHGLAKLANFLLHDFDPIAYVAYWLIFGPWRNLRLQMPRSSGRSCWPRGC